MFTWRVPTLLLSCSGEGVVMLASCDTIPSRVQHDILVSQGVRLLQRLCILPQLLHPVQKPPKQHALDKQK